jgi:antitoxin (DNA-binding transcriptional repressor) of toxin-antitoxin stability system
MQTVGAYEAKTKLPALLERVSKGESFTITRHGTPVALLTKPEGNEFPDAKKAIEGLLAMREEIASSFDGSCDYDTRAMIEEGRM